MVWDWLLVGNWLVLIVLVRDVFLDFAASLPVFVRSPAARV